MKICTDFTLPDGHFWEEYKLLWQNSRGQSPFQAPNILQYFAGKLNGGVIAFQGRRDKKLIAAVVFKKHKGVYSFLSDMKTDTNFFVLSRDSTPNEIGEVFSQFMNIVRQNSWAFMLNNQPAWADYMPLLEKAGKTSGLYWQNIPYSVCPVTEEAPVGDLFTRIDKLRDFRYAVNRLQKQEKAVFEVLTDDTDLDNWISEFCNAHILRWAKTATPSSYRDTERQQFLKNCLRAWSEDQVLIRFSVITSKGRIGFVIGLLEENALVFHATTFHPEYKKFSPGKALIHFIAEWMAQQDIRILDFGDGDEAYKYEVATKENPLNRIFISHPFNLPFVLKTQLIKFVRANNGMYSFYQKKVKRLRTYIFPNFALK